MLDFIKQPWPWYVAGPLIGLIVPLLLLIGNKSFGISSSFRHLCAACVPAKVPFFDYNWKKEQWNLFFVIGIVAGAFIAQVFLVDPEPLTISGNTVEQLQSLGVRDFDGILPSDIFSWSSLFTVRGLVFMVMGGFMIGFGARYAGGCTSGHAIMGLSSLQKSSLVATISFMAGGFLMSWLLLPYLIQL
jgi:uncharacterized protein